MSKDLVITGMQVVCDSADCFLNQYFLKSEEIKKNMNKFKMAKKSKATELAILLAVATMENSMYTDDPSEGGIIIGSEYLCLDKVKDFYRSAILLDTPQVRPNLFSNSANSALSGEVAAEIGLRGVCWSCTSKEMSSMYAIFSGIRTITEFDMPFILIGSIDIFENMLEQNKGYGGMVFVEEKRKAIQRGARLLANIKVFTGKEAEEQMKINSSSFCICINEKDKANGFTKRAQIANDCNSGIEGMIYGCAKLYDIKEGVNKAIVYQENGNEAFCVILEKEETR